MTARSSVLSAGGLTTLSDILKAQALKTPERCLFSYQREDGLVEVSLRQLDLEATAIAHRLQEAGLSESPILLLMPTGPEFLSALFGCLYSGNLAVPAKCPSARGDLERIQSILDDATPPVVITTETARERVANTLSHCETRQPFQLWVHGDVAKGESAADGLPTSQPADVAVLQYTSGSTSQPRGVMLTHGNLINNLKVIQRCFEVTDQTRSVTWLPHYHDMGLIGGLLEPLFAGCTARVFAPEEFLRRPLTWLQTISETRADVSGAPNFAFDLCARVLEETNGSITDLDLSCWELAFCGGEPIHPDVVDRFVQAAGKFGFRRETFFPCYGLAESTLLVAGGKRGQLPHVNEAKSTESAEPAASESIATESRRRIAVGRVLPGQDVQIVDPHTNRPTLLGEEGEVCISGRSVAGGYWHRAAESQETFASRLPNRPDTYLRTGDLGRLDVDWLYITGRIKDLIIVRGQNHYPQDIEATAAGSHHALQGTAAAAFAIDGADTDQVVLVHEILRRHRREDPQPIIDAVRAAVAERHGIQLAAVTLLSPGRIPKTTSGKVQRRLCRQRFLDDNLKQVAKWSATDKPIQVADQQSPRSPAGDSWSAEDFAQWVISTISKQTGAAPSQIDRQREFALFGLDSATTVRLAGDLEQASGRTLSPTLLYEYPTIDRLSVYLAGDAYLAGGTAAKISSGQRSSVSVSEQSVAIVGIGLRIPQANGVDDYWNLLREGRCVVTEAPDRAWLDTDPMNSVVRQLGRQRNGGYLDDIEWFDADHFSISNREALTMDPQQRLLLETAAEALHDAGLTIEQIRETNSGVFLGISTGEYGLWQMDHADSGDIHTATGNASSIAANRLSYHFDLRGPSVALDTACSSSLVALHYACQSLRRGECDSALACGVNLIVSHRVTRLMAKGRFLSPDGLCRSFGEAANGYIRSEGVAIVVLKRLSEAMRDGNAVYAVIRGSAVNQDGRSNGLTAPSPASQRLVIGSAFHDAGIAPHDVDYIEAHGSGTQIGDPIEANVLAETIGAGRSADQICRIGSVKTNLGHLEAASGLAGLTKVALMLQHRKLVPSLHCDSPNPLIPFGTNGLAVQQEFEPWPTHNHPATAGVSSFGFGGTNAHVILQAAPESCQRTPDHQPTSPLPTWNRRRYWPLPPTATGASEQPAESTKVAAETTARHDYWTTMPASEIRPQLDRYLRKQLSVIAFVDEIDIEPESSLTELGVDSVMAMELSQEIHDELGVNIQHGQLAQLSSLNDVLDLLLDKLTTSEAGTKRGAPTPSNVVEAGATSEPLEFAATPIQQQLWLQGEVWPESGSLNIPARLSFDGQVDFERIQQTLNALVRRHDILRARLYKPGSELVQRIETAASLATRVLDLRDMSDSDRQRIRQRELTRAAVTPLPADEHPLVRATWLRLTNSHSELALTVSHLIADGWSMRLLCKELVKAYTGRIDLNSLDRPHQFHDQPVLRNEAASDSAFDQALALWKQRLAAPPSPLALPYDEIPSSLRSIDGARLHFELPATLVHKISGLARQHGATLFTTLLSPLTILLHRLTGQDDIVVGAPFSGRETGPTYEMIGPLMNPIPLRWRVPAGVSFLDLLSQAQVVVDEAQAVQSIPFSSIEEHLGDELPEWPGRSWIQVMFDLQEVGDDEFEVGDTSIQVSELHHGCALAEITWSLRKRGDNICGYVEYRTDRFRESTAQQWLDCWLNLLENAACAPDSPVSELSLMSSDQRRQIIDDWNATACDYPQDSRVEELFAIQANRTPQAVAVTCGREQFTYKELEQAANHAAGTLQQFGCEPGKRVGILLDRSAETLTAILGVLKTGAAYVPIDPAFPEQRQQLILADADVTCVITQAEYQDRLPAATPSVILDAVAAPNRNGHHTNGSRRPHRAEDAAYILYTSGSTGQPKGVTVTHRNVTNFFTAMDPFAGVKTPGVWLAVTTISFDISVFELLWTLTRGFHVVIQRDVLSGLAGGLNGDTSLAAQMKQHGVTHFQCTPPLAEALIKDDASRAAMGCLKKMFVGGDTLPQSLARELAELVEGDVYNVYGPTETTIWSTAHKVSRDDTRVLIGKPIANNRVYVLDHQQQVLPPGVAGELYIGGDGVAVGYFNRNELTAERFVDDPFARGSAARMYRTGDLVKWTPDGELEFLGRIDHQVKIRGHRVELGEVESVLGQLPAVDSARVTLLSGNGRPHRLVACLIGRPANSAQLRQQLLHQLPAHMVPSEFIWMDEYPLTPNGKLDRNRLTSLANASPAPEPNPDTTPVEGLAQAIGKLVADQLGVDVLDPRQSILDLGVNSLEVLEIAQRMDKELGIRVTLREMIQYRSIAELAEAVTQSPLQEVAGESIDQDFVEGTL
jgi:amino acid adenylation domain-containing protein